MTFIAPDWKDELNYPSPETEKNLSFWAWQFLRRNKTYQAEWKEYADDLYSMAGRLPNVLPFVRTLCDEDFRKSEEAKSISNEAWNEMALIAEKQVEWLHFDPPLLPTETTFDDWMKRVSLLTESEVRFTAKAKAIGKKWGIGRVQNPARPVMNPGNKFSTSSTTIKYFVKNPHAGDENYLIQAFDMRLPVDVLRAKFEYILKYREKTIEAGRVNPYKGRPQRSLLLFSKYLRVLDAGDSGAKIPEIAKILLPEQDADGAKKVVRNWINAAKKIKTEDYHVLPAYTVMEKPTIKDIMLLPVGYGLERKIAPN